jgi:hypothetical protein
MNTIEFTAIIGPDGLIHPPPGISSPQGAISVSVRSAETSLPSLETRACELGVRRGLNWDTLPDEARALLIEDVKTEDLGLGQRPPRPGPGACQGMIFHMAPDFDAPLEDLKEYME